MSQVEITELPPPEELMPLTQTLITPDLASAFSIALEPPTSGIAIQLASERTFEALCLQGNSSSSLDDTHLNSFAQDNQLSLHSIPFLPDKRAENGLQSVLSFPDVNNVKDLKLDGGAWSQTSDLRNTVLPAGHEVAIAAANEGTFVSLERRADNGYGSGFGGTDSSECGPGKKPRKRLEMEFEDVESSLGLENSSEEPAARTLKRPRLVWTPPLHKRFVDAVAHLGIKNAVPKTIMQLMNVEGLTRENVASHLQKYRLYLKRMQGLSSEGPSVSDQLFASTPVPPSLAASAHFLSNYGEEMLPLLMPVPMGGAGQSHIIPGSLGSGAPYANFDHHIYSALARSSTSQRLPQADLDYHMESQQRPGSPQSHVLTLFPASGS